MDQWKERCCVTAIRDGKSHVLKSYLDAGVDVSYFEKCFLDSWVGFDPTEFSPVSGSLPLSAAICCSVKDGVSECLALLIDYGMKLGKGLQHPEYHTDLPVEGYRSPMNLAAAAGNWRGVKVLLDRDYPFNERDPKTNFLPGELAMIADEYSMAIKLKVDLGVIHNELDTIIPVSEDFDFGK